MSNEYQAIVFDIEKFAVHDGPGIRTTVFLKGCPLRCLWCHNPESRSLRPELLFSPEKCTGCGNCLKSCPLQCHSNQGGAHFFDRSRCIGCGKCTETCYTDALQLAGRRMTVSQVLEEVRKDQDFYRHSGGGLTLSGGECLAFPDFSGELLRRAKQEGIHTAVETCGYVPWSVLQKMLSVVDLWLWDVKSPPQKHERFTGVPSDLILENLKKLDRAGGKIILRCPLIPGLNDDKDALLFIAELADSLANCQEIDLEPYNPLGETKAEKLGLDNIFRGAFVEQKIKEEWKTFLDAHTAVPVKLESFQA